MCAMIYATAKDYFSEVTRGGNRGVRSSEDVNSNMHLKQPVANAERFSVTV